MLQIVYIPRDPCSQCESVIVVFNWTPSVDINTTTHKGTLVASLIHVVGSREDLSKHQRGCEGSIVFERRDSQLYRAHHARFDSHLVQFREHPGYEGSSHTLPNFVASYYTTDAVQSAPAFGDVWPKGNANTL